MTHLAISTCKQACRCCRKSWQWTLLGICLAISSGCQTMQVPDKLPWAKEEKPAAVNHILAVWTEAVHSQTGKSAQRGFGGRLIFFDAAEQPMEVQGKLTIFVFDDHSGEVQDPAPKYKFVFPAEVLPKHFSKSELGPSYSFWVPLAAGNAPTQHFSLVAKFESAQGETVLSGLTKKVMVGSGVAKSKSESTGATQTNQSAVQPASYGEPVTGAELSTGLNSSSRGLEFGRALAVDPGREIRSETIELTPSFSQRLARAAPPSAPQTIGTASAHGISEGNGYNHLPSGSEVPRRDSQVQPAAYTPPLGLNDSQPAGGASTRSEPQQSQAPAEQLSQPSEIAPRREPHRAGWLSGLPPTPRSGFQMERTMSDRSTSELSRRAEQWFRAQAENPESTAGPTNR